MPKLVVVLVKYYSDASIRNTADTTEPGAGSPGEVHVVLAQAHNVAKTIYPGLNSIYQNSNIYISWLAYYPESSFRVGRRKWPKQIIQRKLLF